LGDNCPLPKAPKQVSISTSNAKDDRVTIRITAPEPYRKVFLSNNREDNPRNIIADLQHWHLTTATRGQLTGGEWKRNYTAQGTQLQGHLKVRIELAQELLKQSGNRALFITQCGNRQHQPTVKWHKRIQNESHEDYFRRIEAIAQAETAPIRYRTGGAADLGTDTSDITHKHLHWELQGAPGQWDDTDLSSFLTTNKWSIHKLHHRRKGWKHTCTWTFQGTAPDSSAESHMYEDENNSIFIHPIAAPRRHQVYAEPIYGPKQTWGTYKTTTDEADQTSLQHPAKKLRSHTQVATDGTQAHQHTTSAEAHPKDETAPTQIDEPSQQENKKREAPSASHQAFLEPDGKNPLHIEHALQSGWTEKDMGGSGDCFFRAWIKAENAYHNKSQSEEEVIQAALQLRIEAVKHMRKHKQQYQELWCNDTMEKQYQRAGQPAPKNFEDFFKQASKKNYWVNEHLIQAVATRTGTPVVIWRAYTDPETSRKLWHRGVWAPSFHNGAAKATGKCGGLTLLLRSNHYTCVLPPEPGDPPSTWLTKAHETLERDWIAGGKQQQLKQVLETPRRSTNTPRWGISTPKTHTSSISGDPPSSCNSTCPNRWGSCTPPNTARWGSCTPGNTPVGTKRKSIHISTTKSSASKSTPKRPAVPKFEDPKFPAKKASPGSFKFYQPAVSDDKGKWTWDCPHCDIQLTGKSSRNLAAKRTSHMKFRHKEIPLHLRASRINRTQIIEASTELPQEKRGWTCPFCSAGLPVFHGYHQKQVNIRHHYDTKHKRSDTSMPAIQKARLKQYRSSKSKQPSIWKGKEQMIAKRLEHNTRDMSIGGHNLCIIRPDWATWPSKRITTPSARKGFLFTCKTCRRVAHDRQRQWKLPCKGAPGQHETHRWEQLQSSPTNQKALLQAWKITKQQADQKFLRLVQTGIEPNPGPSLHQPTSNTPAAGRQPSSPGRHNKTKQHITIASVNVRDAPGVWRLITLMETSYIADIICVQEPCLKI